MEYEILFYWFGATDSTQEKVRYNMTWKSEMEEKIGKIHPKNIPKKDNMIFHLPSRTILQIESSDNENELTMKLIHNEFGCYSGRLTLKKDGTFSAEHSWSEKYIFPVRIWEETEEVTREIFGAAGLEIIEYDNSFQSGAVTNPLYAYGANKVKGKYV